MTPFLQKLDQSQACGPSARSGFSDTGVRRWLNHELCEFVVWLLWTFFSLVFIFVFCFDVWCFYCSSHPQLLYVRHMTSSPSPSSYFFLQVTFTSSWASFLIRKGKFLAVAISISAACSLDKKGRIRATRCFPLRIHIICTKASSLSLMEEDI